MDIRVFQDATSLASAAAFFIADLAQACIARTDQFQLVLSGGTTPALTLRQLALNTTLDWSKVHFFWGDERCADHDPEASNVRMARAALLDHISIPDGNIHPMTCGHDPDLGAQQAELELRKRFAHQALPQFDLVLLGLGEDGHTASLFPGTPILTETARWVAPVAAPGTNPWRISLTLPAINAARQVAFIVSGDRKAGMVKEVLQSKDGSTEIPASLIKPQGDVVWFLDQAAATHLDRH